MSGGDRLLVVDDDQTIADTTALIFSDAGYEARAVYSPESALELIQEWQPSAAIVDVNLLRMDGIELAKLMRTKCPDCRIVLFTAQDLTGDHIAAIRNDFLVLAKPLPPEELLISISELLRTS